MLTPFNHMSDTPPSVPPRRPHVEWPEDRPGVANIGYMRDGVFYGMWSVECDHTDERVEWLRAAGFDVAPLPCDHTNTHGVPVRATSQTS